MVTGSGEFTPNLERCVLRPSRRRTAGLVALCLLFVALGSALIAAGNGLVGGIAVLFFGLGAAVLGTNLLPGAAELRLDREGLEVRSLFRSRRFRWSDVHGFRPVTIPPAHSAVVGFDFSPGARPAGASLASSLAGVEGALPNTYGLSAAELATLLEQWRVRYAPGGQGLESR